MRRWTSFGVLAFTLLTCPAALAQTDEPALTPLEPGARSFAFQLTGVGTGSFGYWRMRSERTNVGWEVALGGQQSWATREGEADRTESTSSTVFLSVGPRFRRYVETHQRVAPFVQTGLSAGYGYHRNSIVVDGDPDQFNTRGHSASLSGSLGLGVEWFPTDRVSVSGHTGLASGIQYFEGGNEFSDVRHWGVFASTFTTALAFQIYFPGPSTAR